MAQNIITLTVRIDGTEYVFFDTSLKVLAHTATEKLSSVYINRPAVIDAAKRWKKNQFFFRTSQITSEISR